MTWRLVLWCGLGAAALFAIVLAGWLLSLPVETSSAAAPLVPREEASSTLAALKPPKRQRPLIAIVGINEQSETTDYLMPYGILTLFPVLKVEPDATVAAFDAEHPDGADYVIVPAMSRDDDPAVLKWINSQAAKGAIIVGVCAGAKVVAATGLLDGKRATTHWYYLKEFTKEHPAIQYVRDRRIVVDRGIATTTGISASMPMSLTLIEAIAGRAKAEGVAREIGLESWDARHNSDAFAFTRLFALTAMRNALAFWQREQLGIALKPGIDEVSLALVADAWSRTYRSGAVTFAADAGALQTRHGIRILPDRVASDWPMDRTLPAIADRPALALDHALAGIAARYGGRTADFVAMQLEYPRPANR